MYDCAALLARRLCEEPSLLGSKAVPAAAVCCTCVALRSRSWSWAVARAALDSLQQHWEQRPGASQTDAVSLRPGQVVLTDRSERALHVVQQSAKERDAV